MTQDNLDTIGNITVSETSDLQIVFPFAQGLPNVVHLDIGVNPKTLIQLFGFTQAITPQNLADTAAFLNLNSLIPVTGTLTDLNGNVTPITINISMLDVDAPVVTLLGSNPVNVEYGSVYVDAGATALDNVDGNVTGNIVVVNPVNTNVLGSYVVTYNVSDVAGNVATEVARTVNVVDTTKPVVTLNGGNITIKEDKRYVELGATWTDNVDGSGVVTNIAGTVNTKRPGRSYVLTYTYVDSSGNVGSAQRIVYVKNVHEDDDDDDDDDDDNGNDLDNANGLLGQIQNDRGFVVGGQNQNEGNEAGDDEMDSSDQGAVKGAEEAKDEPVVINKNDSAKSTPWISWIIGLILLSGLGWFTFKAFGKKN